MISACKVDGLTYRVTCSLEDGEFVGTCDEFPSLSHLDPNLREALHGIKALVGGILEEPLK